MATIQSPMHRCNAVLRALGARYRLREHRRSPWITVYQLGAGGRTREHTIKGYAAADPQAIESLQDLLIEATTEFAVKRARVELRRILEEETMRIGAAASTAHYSKYQV